MGGSIPLIPLNYSPDLYMYMIKILLFIILLYNIYRICLSHSFFIYVWMLRSLAVSTHEVLNTNNWETSRSNFDFDKIQNFKKNLSFLLQYFKTPWYLNKLCQNVIKVRIWGGLIRIPQIFDICFFKHCVSPKIDWDIKLVTKSHCYMYIIYLILCKVNNTL